MEEFSQKQSSSKWSLCLSKISITREITPEEVKFEKDLESMDRQELEKLIADVQKKMKKAAAELNNEAAAQLRDQMIELKKTLADLDG